MGFSLIPREEKFFDLFIAQMENAYQASVLLLDLLTNYTDLPKKVQVIKDLENDGDDLAHDIMERLNKTFITPIDREDIYAICVKLDDIIDYIDISASSFILYNVEHVRSEAISMAEVLMNCCQKTLELVKVMSNIRNIEPMKKLWIEVNRLENVADGINNSAISRLFKEESNPVEILKWDKIFNRIENSIDRCEELASIVESVATKHA